MNSFKKIRNWFSYWFQGTKLGLNLRIQELSRNMRDLGEGIESLEQDLWKEKKFKEDYRDRLTRYYDECIELRKQVKKYNSLLKRCNKFKNFYGKGCSTYISEMRKGNVSKKRG